MVHIVPYATDMGMSTLAAATILTTIGLIGIFGRIILGFTGDRFSNKNTLLISFVLLAVAFATLSISRTIVMIYAFAAIFGSFFGVGILLAPIAAEYFGFKELGVIAGAIYFGNNIGGAMGPVFAGYIFDITGKYEIAFISSGITAILAAVFIGLLKPAPKLKATTSVN
jgi:MFS family permease